MAKHQYVLALGFGEEFDSLAGRLLLLNFRAARAESIEEGVCALEQSAEPIRAVLFAIPHSLGDLSVALDRLRDHGSTPQLRFVPAGPQPGRRELEELRRAGVEVVRYYPGGWRDWTEDASLPIVRIIHSEELALRLAEDRRWFRPNAPPASFAFFDVRHGADYERGHIPGAVNLPSSVFADSLDAALDRHWPNLDRAQAPIVTYCYGERCIRSRATSTAAAREGFVYVERFYGGLDEWRNIGGNIRASVRQTWCHLCRYVGSDWRTALHWRER